MMSALIGIDKFAYAINTKDDKTGASYKPTVFIFGIGELARLPAYKHKEFGADEGVFGVGTLGIAANIGLKLTDMNLRDLAALSSENYDKTSGLFTISQSAVPPYAAIMYRCRKANGAFRYIKLLKARGAVEKSVHKAISNDISPGEMMMNFYAVKRKYDGKIEYQIDSDDPNFPFGQDELEDFEALWFGSPDYILKKG